MKTTLTEFQRHFHHAREAADRGDTVIVTGEHGVYVFERRAAPADHPFAGLEGVFGTVTLPRDHTPLREKVRHRLAAKNRHRRRRTVVLARSYDPAFVLTTDFRDFSTYGVPFASPEGAFHT